MYTLTVVAAIGFARCYYNVLSYVQSSTLYWQGDFFYEQMY